MSDGFESGGESIRRLRHILLHIDKIGKFTEGKSADDLVEDEVLYIALERLLQNIGEASYKLLVETRSLAPDIPWKSIIGMRHVLVHGYDDVDVDEMIVWHSVREVWPC